MEFLSISAHAGHVHSENNSNFMMICCFAIVAALLLIAVVGLTIYNKNQVAAKQSKKGGRKK